MGYALLVSGKALTRYRKEMIAVIDSIVQAVENGENLSMDQMAETIGLIMEGGIDEAPIAGLLAALHRKGETVDEEAGAATAMRRKMTPIRSEREGLIDVVGTGGDGSGTFNISTASAIVTAAAGVAVAKHGNRAVTSRSGSSDVLATLGVNIEADIATVEACLDELGICFCFAPLYHQAMKHVAPVRQKLGTPTIFNILGPLVNPAGAPFQLLGVGKPQLRPLLAQAIARLGTKRTIVVHGTDGLDEVSLGAETAVTEAAGDTLREMSWTAADFDLEPASLDELKIDGPDESALAIRDILAGKPGPRRNVVVANVAAALWTVGRSESLTTCAKQAAEAIDSGAARDLLTRLAERSWGK